MALMQFVRSTPHAREEMVVDAVPLSFERSSHGTFSCVMATRMTLAPLASVISQAGLGVCQVTFADFPQDDAWYDWARTFDHGENLYDLRDEAERNADQRRDVTREVKLMAILFATAAVIFMSADGVTLWGKVQELAKLKKELSVISGEVKDLTRRWERIARARDALQRRVAFPLLARALSSSIPEKVRLSQLAFAADQRIKVQGVAETIADVSAFRAALEAEKVCASVDIKELDKHPVGSTEPVAFALSCLWKENR
jgi:Tfp pilus assembly protein PilN